MDKQPELRLRRMKRVFSDKGIAGRIDGFNYRFFGVSPVGMIGFRYPQGHGKTTLNVEPVIIPPGSNTPVSFNWLFNKELYWISFEYYPLVSELGQAVAFGRVTKNDVHKFYNRHGLPIPGTLKDNVLGGVLLTNDKGESLDVLWYAVPQDIRFEVKELSHVCR